MPSVRWRRRNAVPPFVPPVIVPWPRAGEARDRSLETSEEPDRLKWPVAPPGGDAVVDVIRPLVMGRMLSEPQNQAAILKRADQPRR